MKVVVEAALLARLLDPRPKVFLSAREAIGDLKILTDGVLAGSLDVWRVVDGQGSGVLELWPGTELDATLNAGAGASIRLEQPPAARCLIASSSSPPSPEIESLRDWWRRHGPGEPPPLVTYPAGTSVPVPNRVIPVLEAILREALDDAQRSTRQHASMARQLAVLRIEYEEARVAMVAMEQQLLALNGRPQLRWCLPPGEIRYAPSKRGGLVQRLPLIGDGLAGFDLHFPVYPEPPCDAVHVSLEAAGTGECLGRWRVTAAKLGKGWVRCWLPRALVGFWNELLVRVQWHADGPSSPVFTLADPGDWPELLAHDETGAPLAGPLAVAAWSATPGLALPRGDSYLSPVSEGALEYTLDQDDLSRLRALTPDPEMTYLQLLPDGGFLLHPLANRVATAVLTDGCFPGVDRVTAVLTVNNQLCRSPVSFAMALTHDAQAGCALVTSGITHRAIVAFTGWEQVMPNARPHPLVLRLPQPLAAPAALLFATRTPRDAGVDYAWAHWLELRLRLRSEHVAAQPAWADQGPALSTG